MDPTGWLSRCSMFYSDVCTFSRRFLGRSLICATSHRRGDSDYYTSAFSASICQTFAIHRHEKSPWKGKSPFGKIYVWHSRIFHSHRGQIVANPRHPSDAVHQHVPIKPGNVGLFGGLRVMESNHAINLPLDYGVSIAGEVFFPSKVMIHFRNVHQKFAAVCDFAASVCIWALTSWTWLLAVYLQLYHPVV